MMFEKGDLVRKKRTDSLFGAFEKDYDSVYEACIINDKHSRVIVRGINDTVDRWKKEKFRNVDCRGCEEENLTCSWSYGLSFDEFELVSGDPTSCKGCRSMCKSESPCSLHSYNMINRVNGED